MAENRKWTGWHTVGLLAIIVVFLLIGLLTPLKCRLWTWVGTLILLGIFATIAGHGIVGLWRGLLIDERNKISLSRFQTILWTIVVLSGFLTAALSNVALGQSNPLSIAIPSELWLLMGISTTALVGSPLIKSTKIPKKPNAAEMKSTISLMAKQGVKTSIVATKGQLVVNTSLDGAQWSDLFKGEESGNAAQLDLSKIQMFFFTLILVLAYAAALGTVFAGGTEKIAEFPAFDPGMVTLLGISHAGYLVHKAIPHSQTG